MATQGSTLFGTDLSPSVRTALGWARAATPPSAPVESTALLLGIIAAHAGYSEPEALMAHLQRPLPQLLDAMRADSPELRFEVDEPDRSDAPQLGGDGERVMRAASELVRAYDVYQDGRVHVPHLFGGLLMSGPDIRVDGALRAVLGPARAKASDDYRLFLQELVQNRSVRYAEFLDRHPLVVAAPLPELPDPFVDRAREVEDVRAALEAGQVAVIAGPRGSGKTALAIKAASEVADAYAGGITYVDARTPGAEAAVRAARSRQTVLLLDNADRPELERLVRQEVSGPAVVTTVARLRAPGTTVAPLALSGDDMYSLLRAQAPQEVPDADLRSLVEPTAGLPGAGKQVSELLSAGLTAADVIEEVTALRSGLSDMPKQSPATMRPLRQRYSQRQPHEQRLFGLVGLFDARFSAAQAAQLAETDDQHAEIALAALASAELVEEHDGAWSLSGATRDFARSTIDVPRAEQARLILRAVAARHGIGVVAAEPPALARVRSDEPSRVDHIGFSGDVEALCSVLIAHEVNPPLSVGLFGEWGTGKSTFMRLMRDKIRALQADWAGRDDSPYCNSVKQITFNAWNYSDANLWASLVTKIFDGLAAPDPEVENDVALQRSQRAALVKALETAKATIAAKEVERDEAQQREAELAQRLQTIQEAEDDAGKRLEKISPAEVIEQARRSEKLQELGAEVLSGVAKRRNGPRDAIAVARELQSTWGFAANAAAKLGRGKAIALLALTIALIAAAGVAEALGVPVVGTIAAIAAWVGSVAALARTPVERVRKAAAAGDDLLARLREEEQAAVRRREAEVQRELAQLAAQRAQLDSEIQQARSTKARAEREIADIQSGRRIARFVEERAASAEYRQYLGLIALIRRDFDELTQLLLKSNEADKPPFDRIILYIDDLDRCRPELVVQVLEAVHLLLALPLFVVVVGVDPRWLAESLKRHYIGQLGLDSSQDLSAAAEDWETTPQNYLEKIFQIPFALRPMGDDGFSRMMGQLLDVRTVARRAPEPAGAVVEQAGVTEDGGDGASGDGSADVAGREAAPVARERARELLRIWPAELGFIQRLGPLTPTPRAANRLANTYRLIRVAQDPARLSRFVIREGEAGEYRVALVLLAIVVGFSDIANDVLSRLVAGRHRSFWTFVNALTPPDGSNPSTVATYERLRAGLHALKAQPGVPADISLYREWAPRVARYSFETARINQGAPAAA